jgi:thiamine-phosphate pyrophosphorylase
MINNLQYITTAPHIQNVKDALGAGCKWIQLRIKNPSLEKDLRRGLTSNIQNPPLSPLQGGEVMPLQSPSLERDLGRGKIPLSQLKGINIETKRRTIIPYNPILKEIASNFRKNLTDTETILWSYLKGNKMCGFDFDRQRPIFEFIVDFYCKDLMLAIEVDGPTHDYQYHKDVARQSKIEEFGVTFLRFTNDEVYNDIDNVLRTIENWIETSITQNPPLSPLQGGETSLLLGGGLEVGITGYTQTTPSPSKEGGIKLSDELIQLAREIQVLCYKKQAKLIINDNIELTKLLYADGVHLGLTDTPIAEAREYLGNDFIIGGTANTFEDVVKHYKASADYVGLGPFTFTETKKNLSPVLGIEGYQSILQKCKEAKIDIPIIAIGGIELEDISAIMQTGVSGIAISGLITKSHRKKELVTEINKYLK